MRRLRHSWPAFAWATVIWFFSTGYFSSESTSRFILPVLRWLLPHASLETLELLHHLIRKCGHFVEYFAFSLLLLRAIRGERRGFRLEWALAAIAMAAGYASLDEFHQWFVPGRTASVRDILLDTSGAVAAQLLAGWHARHGKRALANAGAETESPGPSSQQEGR